MSVDPINSLPIEFPATLNEVSQKALSEYCYSNHVLTLVQDIASKQFALLKEPNLDPLPASLRVVALFTNDRERVQKLFCDIVRGGETISIEEAIYVAGSNFFDLEMKLREIQERMYSSQEITAEEIFTICSIIEQGLPINSSCIHSICNQLAPLFYSIASCFDMETLQPKNLEILTAQSANTCYKLHDEVGIKFIFKPASGESELQQYKGILQGTYFLREQFAFSVNQSGFFPIPPTLVLKISDPQEGHLIGSCQLFVNDALPLGRLIVAGANQELVERLDKVSRDQLQACLIFDIIYNNIDRNANNLLVDGNGQLVMIDHGLILSFDASDPLSLDYLALTQLNHPWGDAAKAFVNQWDIQSVIMPLKAISATEAVINRTVNAAEFLKRAIKDNLSPRQTGLIALECSMMLWNKGLFSRLVGDIENLGELKKVWDQLIGDGKSPTAAKVKVGRHFYAESLSSEVKKILFPGEIEPCRALFTGDGS